MIFAEQCDMAPYVSVTNYRTDPSPDPEPREDEYIPVDIEDCIRELKRLLSPDLIAGIKDSREDDLSQYHFSIGQRLRNSWGLWKESSRLTQYFRHLGIAQTDDMSSIILGVYWDALNDRPINITRWRAYNKISQSEIQTGPKPNS